MSSAQTLLSLLPQLKTMEASIVATMMEVVAKLAALTDTSVFVLVEDQQQRKFSGTKHLIHAYLNGSLLPIGNDLELEVAVLPSVKTKKLHTSNFRPAPRVDIEEKILLPMNDVKPAVELSAEPAALSDPEDEPDKFKFGQKRCLPATMLTDDENCQKRTFPTTMLTDDENCQKRSFPTTMLADDYVTSAKQARLDTVETWTRDKQSQGHPNHPTQDSSPLRGEIDLTDENDIFEYSPEDRNGLSPSSALTHPLHLTASLALSPHHPLPPARASPHPYSPHQSAVYQFQSYQPNQPNQQPNPALMSSFTSSLTLFSHQSEHLVIDFDSLNLPKQKMDFLKSVKDTGTLFDKGTAESKVLTSIFYDFGKALGVIFPYKDDSKSEEESLDLSKAFLNANLEAFIKEFPNFQLETFPNLRIYDMKPETFLRLHARNGFKRSLNGQKLRR